MTARTPAEMTAQAEHIRRTLAHHHTRQDCQTGARALLRRYAEDLAARRMTLADFHEAHEFGMSPAGYVEHRAELRQQFHDRQF